MLDYSIKKKIGRLNKWRLNNNAGFFTQSNNEEEYLRFCNIYIDALKSMDLFGVWFMPGEDYIINRYSSRAEIAKLRCLEPYFYENPWSLALKGKTVLVVSPFDALIKSQYNKHSILFDNEKVLPNFELKTFRAVQTIGKMKDGRFESWFEALQYMKNEISKIDFDVALVGCGAYSLPLASYIKSLGRGAIHTGGTTQILFGIKGKRWDEMPDINKFYNDFWVRPEHNADIEKATTATEDYW